LVFNEGSTRTQAKAAAGEVRKCWWQIHLPPPLWTQQVNGSKRVHQETEKVHDKAKEVH
jgi:hypothetical protein